MYEEYKKKLNIISEYFEIDCHFPEGARNWKSLSTHREIYLGFLGNQPKADCIYHFPMDLASYGNLFNSKLIVKC